MTLIVADGIPSILEKLPANTVELIGMLGLVLFGLVCAIGAIWHQFHKSNIESTLKREMIERGMSADEIERVLAAKMGPAKTPAVVMRFGTKSSTPTDKQTMPYSEPKPK
jgi:hypothetical protein